MSHRPASRRARILRVLALSVSLSSSAEPGRALDMTITYADAPGEGFFDPALGAARRTALETAVQQWATVLSGGSPTVVEATMEPLGGTGGNATLASTGATTVHRNFGDGRANTWYGAALANQLAGGDLNGEQSEITVTFNSDIDGPEILGSIGWYYGVDAQPGVDIDFVTIALHELAHGLGFFETIDGRSGAWRLGDDPGVFDRMLFRPGVGRLSDMVQAERLAAITAPGLLWDGPSVVAFNGSGAAVYTPDPFAPNASVGHWDSGFTPDELIEPFYTTANHEIGLLLPAMLDMGWEVAVNTPTPRASPATPTPTYPPRPTLTAGQPPTGPEVAYVTNFDDGTLSVIDTSSNVVTATVAVGDGPIGVAVAPSGREVYVGNFHEGTLAVMNPRALRVVNRIAIGPSANGVAISPDGAVVLVTDTAGDQVALVATDTGSVIARVAAGPQPSGVALDAAGRLAFVTNFGRATVVAIDLDARLLRAVVPMQAGGLLGIAIAPSGKGYATSSPSGSVVEVDTARLFGLPQFFPFPSTDPRRVEAVTMNGDGALGFVTSHHPETGAGMVTLIDTGSNEGRGSISVGRVPEALALSSNGERLYVANTGSDTLSVIDVPRRRVTGTIIVGRAPMGVALGRRPAVCDADCNADFQVSVSELVSAVSIALGQSDIEVCLEADADGSGGVTIDELVRAVDRALEGCPL